MKYAENGDFEHGCREALKQIDRNHYADYFEQIGVEKVRAYGIACYKKQCRVWYKQVMRRVN